MEFVKKEAAKRGLPVIEGKVDVKAYQKNHQIGTQEAARTLRYDFFQKQLRGQKKPSWLPHITQMIKRKRY